MQQTISGVRSQATKAVGDSVVADIDERQDPWEALERFVERLRSSEQESRQRRYALELVVEGGAAETACVFAEDAIHELAGAEVCSAEECLAIAFSLKDRLPGPGEPPFVDKITVDPDRPDRGSVSVVMARLGRSRPSWILALRRDQGLPLGPSDARLIDLAARMLADRQHHARTYDRLKDTLFGLIRCLTAAIDAKDPYTCGHSERVARIATRIGKQMKLPSSDISDLYVAGLLHDVGKIGIRDDVLCKPTALTAEEFAHIQEHPGIGDRIISEIRQFAYLRPAVRGHHERWDGRGYPDGLAGEGIPSMARILAVTDSCDAMMSARRYRTAMPRERIEAILREGAGTQWDPKVIEHFMACREDIYPICQIGLGDSLAAAIERAAGQKDIPNLLTQALSPNSYGTGPLQAS